MLEDVENVRTLGGMVEQSVSMQELAVASSQDSEKERKKAEKVAAFLNRIELDILNNRVPKEQRYWEVEEDDFSELRFNLRTPTITAPTSRQSILITDPTKAKGLASIPLESEYDYLVFGYLVYIRLQICSDLNIAAFYKGLSKVLRENRMTNEALDIINRDVIYIRNHLFSIPTGGVPVSDISSPNVVIGARVLANYPIVCNNDYLAFGKSISERMRGASADNIAAFYTGLSKVLCSERMSARVFDTITQQISSIPSERANKAESAKKQKQNVTNIAKTKTVITAEKQRRVFGEAEKFTYDEKDDHVEDQHSRR